MSMEEITPTMPSVMYLKYLKITGYSFDSQGKFEYAVCLCDMKIQIPHFLLLTRKSVSRYELRFYKLLKSRHEKSGCNLISYTRISSREVI